MRVLVDTEVVLDVPAALGQAAEALVLWYNRLRIPESIRLRLPVPGLGLAGA